MKKFTANIVGASGLVGGELVKILDSSSEFSAIKSFVRSPTPELSDKVNQIKVDFDQLALHQAEFQADIGFCCLGTTIKTAGSKEAFKKVDYEYIVSFAKLCYAAGVRKFVVISSMGADKNSTFFYNQVKGDTEAALKNIPFKALHILQPSLLMGDRKESRAGESIAKFLLVPLQYLLIGPLKKFRPIKASKVAAAMVQLSTSDETGINTYNSEQLQNI